jgi:hypothetical protein
MADAGEGPYQVRPEDNQFQVLDASNRVVMVSHDQASATQYSVLLNEAYSRGYKSGYRAARNTSGRKP